MISFFADRLTNHQVVTIVNRTPVEVQSIVDHGMRVSHGRLARPPPGAGQTRPSCSASRPGRYEGTFLTLDGFGVFPPCRRVRGFANRRGDSEPKPAAICIKRRTERADEIAVTDVPSRNLTSTTALVPRSCGELQSAVDSVLSASAVRSSTNSPHDVRAVLLTSFSISNGQRSEVPINCRNFTPKEGGSTSSEATHY